MSGIGDVKQKIKKLLALAERGNEHEAKVAMAKAQMIMAQYKLQMSDIAGQEQSKIIQKQIDLYFTEYRNGYIRDLAGQLSEFYCCKTAIVTAKGSSKHYIKIIGFEDDINIFENLLLFAHSCINDWFKQFKRVEGWKYSNKYLNAVKNQYGKGFAVGIRELLEEQTRHIQQEWGLVMTVPREATDYVDSLSPFRCSINITDEQRYYREGHYDGLHAEIGDKIGERKRQTG